MASLTLSAFQTEVLLACGNMQSSHPMASAGLHTRAINRAANRLIRMAVGPNAQYASLFPEHHDSWTVGPTIVGSNSIAMPLDCIIVTDISSAQSSSLPTWANTDEKPLGNPISLRRLGMMAKSSTIADYPRIWARNAKSITYWPTTRTGYTDYFNVYGVARETALSSASEQFVLSEDWDGVIVDLAVSEVLRKMGKRERADEMEAQAKRNIAETVNVMALGDDIVTLCVDGSPTRFDVHGGFE